MTGRGAGYCAGYPAPGFMNPAWGCRGRGFGPGRAAGYGRAWGRGRGLGRGWGWGFAGSPAYPAPAPVYGGFWGPGGGNPPSEYEFLKERAGFLKDQLDAVEARLEELKRELNAEGEERGDKD